jgi:hypothetical protein
MKIPTQEQYGHMVRAMPTRELEALADTFGQSTTLTHLETLIKSVIDAEMERRIAQWEAQS